MSKFIIYSVCKSRTHSSVIYWWYHYIKCNMNIYENKQASLSDYKNAAEG